jgi:hypothetical protein
MNLTDRTFSRLQRVFLLAIVIACAAGILAATACERPPADATTPEGAVRLYLETLKAGDIDAAYAMLSAKLQTECKVDSLKTRRSELRQQLEDASVVVRRTEITGTTASVEVSINSGGADVRPFGPRSTGGFDNAYRLVMVAGTWQLSEHGWPVYWCEPGGPEKPRGVEPAATPAVATPPPPTATPTARAPAP